MNFIREREGQVYGDLIRNASMGDGDTLMNAIIGAAVTIITTAFVPAAPLLGGALGGYLEGGTRGDGLRVGLYAGLLALLPLVLIIVFFGGLFLSMLGAAGAPFPGFGGHAAVGSFGLLFFILGILSMLFYVVALSVVGGWVGNYVRTDTDF